MCCPLLLLMCFAELLANILCHLRLSNNSFAVGTGAEMFLEPNHGFFPVAKSLLLPSQEQKSRLQSTFLPHIMAQCPVSRTKAVDALLLDKMQPSLNAAIQVWQNTTSFPPSYCRNTHVKTQWRCALQNTGYFWLKCAVEIQNWSLDDAAVQVSLAANYWTGGQP